MKQSLLFIIATLFFVVSCEKGGSTGKAPNPTIPEILPPVDPIQTVGELALKIKTPPYTNKLSVNLKNTNPIPEDVEATSVSFYKEDTCSTTRIGVASIEELKNGSDFPVAIEANKLTEIFAKANNSTECVFVGETDNKTSYSPVYYSIETVTSPDQTISVSFTFEELKGKTDRIDIDCNYYLNGREIKSVSVPRIISTTPQTIKTWVNPPDSGSYNCTADVFDVYGNKSSTRNFTAVRIVTLSTPVITSITDGKEYDSQTIFIKGTADPLAHTIYFKEIFSNQQFSMTRAEFIAGKNITFTSSGYKNLKVSNKYLWNGDDENTSYFTIVSGSVTFTMTLGDDATALTPKELSRGINNKFKIYVYNYSKDSNNVGVRLSDLTATSSQFTISYNSCSEPYFELYYGSFCEIVLSITPSTIGSDFEGTLRFTYKTQTSDVKIKYNVSESQEVALSQSEKTNLGKPVKVDNNTGLIFFENGVADSELTKIRVDPVYGEILKNSLEIEGDYLGVSQNKLYIVSGSEILSEVGGVFEDALSELASLGGANQKVLFANTLSGQDFVVVQTGANECQTIIFKQPTIINRTSQCIGGNYVFHEEEIYYKTSTGISAIDAYSGSERVVFTGSINGVIAPYSNTLIYSNGTNIIGAQDGYIWGPGTILQEGKVTTLRWSTGDQVYINNRIFYNEVVMNSRITDIKEVVGDNSYIIAKVNGVERFLKENEGYNSYDFINSQMVSKSYTEVFGANRTGKASFFAHLFVSEGGVLKAYNSEVRSSPATIREVSSVSLNGHSFIGSELVDGSSILLSKVTATGDLAVSILENDHQSKIEERKLGSLPLYTSGKPLVAVKKTKPKTMTILLNTSGVSGYEAYRVKLQK